MDRSTGQFIGEIYPPLQDVIFTRRGKLRHATPVVISGNVIVFGTARGIEFWNATTRRSILKIHLGSPVTSIALKQSAVFVGCFNGLVRIDLT